MLILAYVAPAAKLARVAPPHVNDRPSRKKKGTKPIREVPDFVSTRSALFRKQTWHPDEDESSQVRFGVALVARRPENHATQCAV